MSKVAPWSSWAEFHGVYLQLTSSSPAERTRGVRRVETWRTRCRLPVAVDITASFVEIMLNDAYLNPETESPRSDNELRLMYAMAVVRLVNGIVDRQKPQRMSILERAQGLEWPQFFVDIRHDASHQNLPSLPVLRLAAQEAVWLLVERFWRPQLHQIEERGAAQTLRTDRVRAARTLDRRLKALISKTACSSFSHRQAKRRKRKHVADGQQQDEMKDGATEASAHEMAEELSALAPDEGRLLARIFEVVMTKEPHADQREAKALHMLCETCSENFAVRLMREILCRAAGLPGAKLDVAPDNYPSLRSISDGFYHCEVKQEEVSAEECDRMLLWLWSLLSLPPPQPSTSSRPSRLQQALRGLLPSLRHRILGQMANANNLETASRASKLWRALQIEGLDDGAEMFASLCEVLDSGHGAETDRPAGLEKIEELLEKQQSKDSGLCPRPNTSDSWTAVGTLLDQETLSIVCREEHTDEVFLPATAKQTWLDWAATETEEAVDRDVITFSSEIPADPVKSTGYTEEKPPFVEVAVMEESNPAPEPSKLETLADQPEEPEASPKGPKVQSISAERFQHIAKELMKQVLQPWSRQ